jgi:hypothetical protein
MNKSQYISFLLLTLICFVNKSKCVSITNGCPQYCTCTFVENIHLIQCTQAQSPASASYNLPDLSYNPTLSTTQGVSITNSYWLQIPSNLCQIASTLKILDLSSNLISQALDGSTFNCLTN